MQVLKQRSDLKLVVMSATLEAEKVSGLFFGCPFDEGAAPISICQSESCHAMYLALPAFLCWKVVISYG